MWCIIIMMSSEVLWGDCWVSTHGGSGAPPPGGPGVVQSRQHLLAGVGLVYDHFYTFCFVGYHGNGSCNVLQKPGWLKGVYIQNLYFIHVHVYVTHNAMLHYLFTSSCDPSQQQSSPPNNNHPHSILTTSSGTQAV